MKTSNPPVLELRVAITTQDFARLARFYLEGLGLEPAAVFHNDGGNGLLLEMGRATLEIFDEPQAAAVDQIEAGQRLSGPVRFALRVPDVQAAMDALIAKGATLVHPPVVPPWGGRNVRLQDPDGMQITLFEAED